MVYRRQVAIYNSSTVIYDVANEFQLFYYLFLTYMIANAACCKFELWFIKMKGWFMYIGFVLASMRSPACFFIDINMDNLSTVFPNVQN